MNPRVRQHHRATLRRIAELEDELDHAIARARELADSAPDSEELEETLEQIGVLDAQLLATRRVAITLNRLLPTPQVRLIPPTPTRFPTPRPHHGRSWAKVAFMTARPPRPTHDT